MTSNQNHAYSMMGPELSKPSCLEQQAHWYAVYTCSRHEKRVAEQLDERRIENFLPVYEAVRRWSDRVKRLEFPLFPSYLLVRIGSRERLRVLQVPSVVSIVNCRFNCHSRGLTAAHYMPIFIP